MYLNNEDLPAVLTFAEVRDYLYIGRNTLLNLLHNKALKGFRVGKHWRIKKEDLIDFTQQETW